MRKIFLILFFITALSSCDDGDIIVTTFDFDEIDLKQCGASGDYVFFKINNQNFETLSLKLQASDSILLSENTFQYPLNGTSNVVHYRTYNGEIPENYFCTNIPSETPVIKRNYTGSDGTVHIQTVISDTIITGTGQNADSSFVYTAFFELRNLKMVSENETVIQELLELGSVNNTQ